MRLLQLTEDGEFVFTKDIVSSEEIPPYAILSHTWGQQEVLLDDVKNFDSTKDIDAHKKDGWEKIRFCAERARHDGLEYFWVDTCCIDKANFTELSEAINSMFRWYQKADKCYVFLPDVQLKSTKVASKAVSRWKAAFRNSKWFSRGWTLQELLAPHSVEFFSKEGVRLGDKESLKHDIHEVTNIPMEALSGMDLSKFDIDERFSWAANRQTTREEDAAYCLLGVLGCHLPLIYGEGIGSALKRLRKEALEASDALTSAEANNTETREQNLKERRLHIRSWLIAPDPSTNYHKAHKQRQADTGLWLLESPKFREWKESAASRLWLYGIPGCGKTILSSTIVDHVLKYCHGDTRNAIAYFYFDFNDAQKQDPELMLRSLIRQLLQRSDIIPEDVEELFAFCKDGLQQPTVHALLEVAPQIIRQFTHVYIVLDALDECTRRQELMDMLETLAGWQLDNVHLLMTGRKERDIEMSLETYMNNDDAVCLQRDVVDRDILRYVQQRLRDEKNLAKWSRDPVVRQQIETALKNGAHGMFRWAVCQLDTLTKCRNLTMLQVSLATLPKTLDQTYDRILNSIREEDYIYAIRILQWLTFSARPLTVREVAEVVAIDVSRRPAFDCNEVLVDPLEALEICSGLVTVATDGPHYLKTTQRVLTLAHYSVQEYLVSDRIRQGPAKQYSMRDVECHTAITRATLSYLSQFSRSASIRDIQMSALGEYSAKFWSSHLEKTGEVMEEVSQLAMGVLSTERSAYELWVKSYDLDSYVRATLPAPLYYGALLGLRAVTTLLLKQRVEINAQGGKFGNALQAASAQGHKAVVELLIDSGADVNASDGHFGSPLQAASAGGHEQVAMILLNAGAAVNTRDGHYNNALHAALVGAHETTVRLLLERGADVSPDIRLQGAIHYAVNSALCTPSLIRILRQAGASLDAIDIDKMTPLHYCVKYGHKAVAKQLIDLGAPIDSKGRRQSQRSDKPNLREAKSPDLDSVSVVMTPLHFAALHGNSSMTKFLLKHGADPNALSEYNETPLHLALSRNLVASEYNTVWTRLGFEAKYGTPGFELQEESTLSLIPKIFYRWEEVMDEILADPRVSLTAKDWKGKTILHYVLYGYGTSYTATLVRKFIARGADPNSGDLSQMTPLHLAIRAGDQEAVKTMLSMGAKVALTDNYGYNALHYAARKGYHETIVAILETKEASEVKLISSKDKCGQNVLHHLFSETISRRRKTVQWLLDHGADGSELDNYGFSPLARLIQNSTFSLDPSTCKPLLETKGNALFVDRSGKSLGHLLAATYAFKIEGLELLHKYGVDLAKKDCVGRTILHCSAKEGNLTEESLDFLVYVIGIQLGEEDKRHRTALQYAVEEASKHRDPGSWDIERWGRTSDILSKCHAKQVGMRQPTSSYDTLSRSQAEYDMLEWLMMSPIRPKIQRWNPDLSNLFISLVATSDMEPNLVFFLSVSLNTDLDLGSLPSTLPSTRHADSDLAEIPKAMEVSRLTTVPNDIRPAVCLSKLAALALALIATTPVHLRSHVARFRRTLILDSFKVISPY
ncbi:hypothetical protein IG631_22244 [Alternaria alternata]|nr:hypothetical protein IG631_22244 [Alternaria alternata]